MNGITPTIGRIVWYKLNSADAIAINARRDDAREKQDLHRTERTGSQVHVGNHVQVGELCPAMVVRVWGDTPGAAVNLQVMLDGNDSYWATSRVVGENEGDYQWMPYQKGQAAKADAEAAAKVPAG